MRSHIRKSAFAVLISFGLVGCEEEQVAVPERIRAIKTFTVTEAAGGNARKFPGTIVAADKSSLSFPAAGTVATVDVKQGDKVKSGQVLATLDPKPFLLDVDAAKSQLKVALSAYEEKSLDLERQRTLYDKKIAAKAALDKAAAAAATVQGDVDVARSRLAKLERDLAKTKLRSPFDGTVAVRTIEPFAEVSAGQSLFEINAGGSYEIEISVPDKDIKRIAIGQPITVEIDGQTECGCSGQITEIGTVSGTANAVKVLAAITSGPSDLLPGTSATAGVVFASRSSARGYLVPIVAVAAAADGKAGGAYIFKYSPDSGTVSRVAIKAGEGRENLIEVTEGVELGDVIAAAGVSFLRDGQKVKPAASAN